MHIRLTRFLEVDFFNTEYDSEGKFCERYTNINWDDDDKIKELMAADNDKDNDKKDSQKKNRQLKKEK